MKKAQLRKALEILPSEPVPAGQYLVHNDMTPTKPLGLGLHGFRAWIQTKPDNLVECRCNFGGCMHSKLHKLHYRVDRRTFDQPAQLQSEPQLAMDRLLRECLARKSPRELKARR